MASSCLTSVQRVGVISANKTAAQAAKDGIIRDLIARDLTVFDERDLDRGARADLLVVLGGDGSILRATRRYPDIPVLGVNYGQIGFLAVVEQHNWRSAIERVLAGDCIVRDEPTLDVAVTRRASGDRETVGWVVNDAVVRSRGPLIYTELYVGGRFVNVYPGDGMIVSTALGSTGYSMAADGPVLINIDALVLTPICPHSPLRVTMVVPAQTAVDLVVARGREGVLWLDGVEATALAEDDAVEVRPGEHEFHPVMFSETSYAEAFASKFGYQIRRDWKPTRSLTRS